MPPRCSICDHPDRVAIDRAIIEGESLRAIAGRTGTAVSSLHRHKDNHLASVLQKAHKQAQKAVAKQAERVAGQELDVMGEVQQLFDRMHRMLDACHEWLLDPEDETRYELGPRAHEIMVTYEFQAGETKSGTPIIKRKKRSLQDLLDTANANNEKDYTLVETKQADPRKLIIETAARLQAQTELLAKLIGTLDERPQVNFLVMPEWQALRAEIVSALRPYPDALTALSNRMKELKAGE